MLGILALLAWTTGCSVTSRGERQPLELDGPVSVEINSFAGDVTVRSSGDGGKAHVTVYREALHAPNRRGDAGEALESIEWNTRIDRDDRGPRLVVDITTDDQEAHILRAHVDVSVPSLDGVRIRTSHGDVDVDELTGPVDLVTSDGTVILMSNQPLHDPISIFTSEGDVNVRLAPDTSGELNLHAQDGRVGMHIKSGQMIVSGETNYDTFHGQLNDGTAPFIIRTTNGTIRFTVKTNPKNHGIFHLD